MGRGQGGAASLVCGTGGRRRAGGAVQSAGRRDTCGWRARAARGAPAADSLSSGRDRRHASERKLVAASERVASRAGPRHALRTPYARAGELSCPWTSHACAPINKAICPCKGTVFRILVHDKQYVKTLYSSFELYLSLEVSKFFERYRL